MVSSSSSAPSLSYADRAKIARAQPSSNSPSSSSTSTTDVEKQPDDGPNGSFVNGQASTPAPNFWAARKEQMAVRSAPTAASSSSSPTLAASPALPTAPLPNSRGANGVDLTDTSSWPQVAAATTPVKDKSSTKDRPTTPTPTPKKGEKTKWVLIPPTELQAAADAATRGRSSPKYTSAATSTHSSPKASSRGRKLPADDSAPDAHRRSPSRLAKHAYTHPLNSPTRPSVSLAQNEPHEPPLTLQRRPASPARSGPVAGYRDIDDLTRAAGRLVMFGTIGAPAGAQSSPLQRGQPLGLEAAAVEPQQAAPDGAPHSAREFAIGLAPDEIARTRARRRRSAPDLVGTPEIVDLTDGAWQRSNGDERAHERKWEFGTSRHSAVPQQQQQQQQPPIPLPPPPPMHMYPPHPQMAMYPPPLPPGPPMNPDQVIGDPTEFDPRSYGFGEPYSERRGGFPGRRGRYPGGRGGPNGRGFGGRRGGGGPSQHYFPPAPPPPPPPPPGPDGYYMGPPYSVPYIPSPAPVPMPVTMTSFPIDPTRWYLLGQLEYYFSVQNLVTDFWLRKQMDNRGWVPISVIASFNRVRHLTYDGALVRDVLQLSALVEVRGERVRLRDRRWVPFVLPDAPVSEFPDDEADGAYVAPVVGEQRDQPVEEAEVEEEEEEVEFVMGRETEEQQAAQQLTES